MRGFDFTPFVRSTVGFDRVFNLLEDNLQLEQVNNYPPYNIEKTGSDSYRIEVAVAGFGPDELTITAQPNLLLVVGDKQQSEKGQYLHQGIAARAFERRFNLADHIKVTGAKLENGLLSVDLVREIPEAMKPRTIQIETGAKLVKVLDKAKAA